MIAALVALARVSGKDELHRKPTDPTPDPALQGQDPGRPGCDRLVAPRPLRSRRLAARLRAGVHSPGTAGRRRRAVGWPRSSTACSPRRPRRCDLLLAEILAYLQAPTAAREDHGGPAGGHDPGGADPVRARSSADLKTGWTPPLREEYFRWFVTTAAAYRGGNTFASSLRTIKAQAIGDADRRRAGGAEADPGRAARTASRPESCWRLESPSRSGPSPSWCPSSSAG